MWLGLAISLAFIPGYTGASIPTSWAVLSCALPLILWKPVSSTAVHWALGGFFLYALASTTWAINRYDAIYGLWLLAIVGGCFIYGAELPSLRQTMRGLAIGFGLSSALAVSQWLGHAPVLVNTGYPGLAFNAMLHGEILALIILGLVIERDWYFIPALLPGLLLSQSRGAYAALALGLVLTRVRSPVLIVLGAASAAFIATLHLSISDADRLNIWHAAWTNLTLFGHGPGSFLSVWFQPTPTTMEWPQHAHNDALQLAFEYGIGAAIPMAVCAFLLARVESQEWPLFAVFIFLGLFSFPLYSPITSVIGAMAAGRIVRDWAVVRRRLGLRRLSLLQRSYIAEYGVAPLGRSSLPLE